MKNVIILDKYRYRMFVKYFYVYTDFKDGVGHLNGLKKRKIKISDNKYVLLHIYLVRRLHDINTFI